MIRRRLLTVALTLAVALCASYAQAQDFSGGAVQIKSYPLDGKHELTPLFQTSVNDKFTSTTAFGLQYLWHFGEYLGFGADFVYALSSETNLIEVMRKRLTVKQLYGQPSAPVEPYRRLPMWMTGATVHVNPLYGKWSLASELNLRWDLFIAVGGGVISTALGAPIDAEEATGTEDAKVLPAGNVGLGLRFYIMEWLALRVEVRDWIYSESGVVEISTDGEKLEETKIKQLPLATLGVSFLL